MISSEIFKRWRLERIGLGIIWKRCPEYVITITGSMSVSVSSPEGLRFLHQRTHQTYPFYTYENDCFQDKLFVDGENQAGDVGSVISHELVNTLAMPVAVTALKFSLQVYLPHQAPWSLLVAVVMTHGSNDCMWVAVTHSELTGLILGLVKQMTRASFAGVASPALLGLSVGE